MQMAKRAERGEQEYRNNAFWQSVAVERDQKQREQDELIQEKRRSKNRVAAA